MKRALVILASLGLPAGAQDEAYETGGPLAGVKLPPSKRGGWGEAELYPGSVEHFRAYFFKYLPIRSFFDRQSQLKNWVVPGIPGAEGMKTETFAPPVYKLGRDSTGEATGQFQDAVAVLRCAPRRPVFKLDLGELGVGLYAVRAIGAVETSRLRKFREPLYLTLRVNDGAKGETNAYRVRVGYVDDFYSVAEFTFHAVERRAFSAELFVDEGSTVDLLLHNVTLDDVLAGTTRRAIKTSTTLASPETLRALKESGRERRRDEKPFTAEERAARDEAIWKWLPPINAQGGWLDFNVPGAAQGTGDKAEPEIVAEWGKWEDVGLMDARGIPRRDPSLYDGFLVNRKLGLKYTADDFRSRKPLPDPYPYKADGAGLFFPDPDNPAAGRYWDPIATAAGMRIRSACELPLRAAQAWHQTGNGDVARDAAILLVRYAYQFPTFDTGNWLHSVALQPGPYGREVRCRQREMVALWMTHYQNYGMALEAYDLLFDYLKGNEEFAASVGRFVPWVKGARDVVRLLDVYLVQTTAKRVMRYHYHTIPTVITDCATVLGDRTVTDPWMEWQFSRTFVYPLQPAGLGDVMITGCEREGPEYIGSVYYAQGEGASRAGDGMTRYLVGGGDPRYDLSDPVRYPKPLAHCYWQLGIMIGGLEFCRVGDVSGPDKRPGATVPNLEDASRRGWKWSRDPRFAWILKHVFGRKGETDAEWGAIEKAAAAQRRAPWLDNPSRQVANWFGALETGLDHDDPRFRRAAYLRVGLGIGHEHNDSLDLQVVAHGVPMTIDDGQRSGYTKPSGRHMTRLHNTVEVDGKPHRVQSWVRALSDAPGARYLEATAVPPAGARHFSRQIALVDVDEGKGSRPLDAASQKPGARLPAGVETANSYVFDVFRVSGGTLHTYGFHGPVSDAFETNALGVNPPEAGTPEAGYLSVFSSTPESTRAGTAPDVLEATWRYTRDGKVGSEQQMLGGNFDASAPRKLTRLHLLDAKGARFLQGDLISLHPPIPYRFTQAMVQKAANESAFVALVEPYAGEPFITGRKLLPVEGNEADALRAAAVEVKTRNGRTDVCFADGRPGKARRAGGLEVAGEFAYHSTDAEGLRQAALTGGTLLAGPDVRIEAAARERTGRVVAVDYLKKTITLDASGLSPGVFEIGVPGHMTSYTAASVAGPAVTVTRGADYYRSPVEAVSANRVECRLNVVLGGSEGLNRDWVASNDQMTQFWRADLRGGNDFILKGAPVSAEDFAPSGTLRLWEYGVGDAVRQSTWASLRRVEPQVYELSCDVDVSLSFKGKPAVAFPPSKGRLVRVDP